jgi:cysteinyl-tRNA synthetase
MTLRVYDTLTRREREFEPVRPGHVGLYVCGMTVQDKPHIGHFLPFLTADVIRRYLEYKGYQVTHVQNFTDVDDKIIARAEAEGITAREVAERNIARFHEAAAAMNVLPATHYPKATEHIPEIVALIEALIAKGVAYAAANGDVYFRVRRLPSYGKLSGRKIDDLMSGARIEVGEQKDDPLDFALWKAAKPGEPAWASPWGQGRPGWHIECSAMAMKYLGETLDMHGGGRDLLFPHHENELAQSEAATGKPFVRYWMHNGLLYTSGQKMSKSLGNFFLIEDLLQHYSADELRFFLLSTHFRSQAEYSQERLDEARAAFQRILQGMGRLEETLAVAGADRTVSSAAGVGLREAAERLQGEYFAALDADFNTAAAFGKIFELVRLGNRFVDEAKPGRDGSALATTLQRLREMLHLLGFTLATAGPAGAAVPEEVASLAEARQEARRQRRWSDADGLRDRLLALGWVVEDRPDGYRLQRRSGA